MGTWSRPNTKIRARNKAQIAKKEKYAFQKTTCPECGEYKSPDDTHCSMFCYMAAKEH